MKSRTCDGCIWEDDCDYGPPCGHYTPTDYEERFEERDEKMRKTAFMDEWRESVEDEWSFYLG